MVHLVGGCGEPGEQDRLAILDERPEPLDVGGAERDRLADGGWAGVSVAELEAEGESAGEQAEADRDAVGVQAVADRVVEVHAVEQLLDDLLDAPPPAIGCREALRPPGAEAADVDPGAASVDRGAGAEGDQAQAGVPGARAQADCPAVAQPAPLLPAQGGQAGPDRGRAGEAEDERDARLEQGGDRGAAGEAAGHPKCRIYASASGRWSRPPSGRAVA